MKNFFGKFLTQSKAVATIEQKGDIPTAETGRATTFESLYEMLVFNSFHDLAAAMAINYVKKVAPCWHAMDMLSDECSTIPPILFNRQTKEYLYTHPLITLMNSPGPSDSGASFLKDLFGYYLITGNAYFVGTGNSKRPPLELLTVHPTRISYMQSNEDGYLNNYNVNTIGFTRNFFRREVKGKFRYVTEGDDQELFHIRCFNPNYGINNVFFGLSKLTPIFYELEQFLQASIHNKSVLEKGATLSGMFSTAKNLSDEQFARLQGQINNFFTGASNAGRPFLAEGDMKFASTTSTNRDMDFRQLKLDCRNMIYAIFKIPMPIVIAERMTMSNMDQAVLSLYDNAVLPLYKQVMRDVGYALLPRFDLDPAVWQISYMEDDIPALAARNRQQTATLGVAGVLTINEIRKGQGREPVPGGDVIYQPNNLIELGTDPAAAPGPNSGDNTGRGARQQTRRDPAKPNPLKRQKFIDDLMSKTDEDGDPLYRIEDVEDMADSYGF